MRPIYTPFLIFLLLTASTAFSKEDTKEQEKDSIHENVYISQQQGFTENKGQIIDRKGDKRPDVLFQGDGKDMSVYIRNTGFSYVLSNQQEVSKKIKEQSGLARMDGVEITAIEKKRLEQELLAKSEIHLQQIDVNFIGANKFPKVEKREEVKGYNNYYLSNTVVNNVRTYKHVIYKAVYHNIDVAYWGNNSAGLKYDIIVNPGANPNNIKISYEGADGVELVDGKLQVKTFLGKIEEYLPKVYQLIDGETIDINAAYVLTYNEEEIPCVAFELGGYNKAYPLIIDPWVTYYGGSKYERGEDVTTDNLGNVYITGETGSTNAIAAAGHQNVFGSIRSAFLVKFNAAGIRQWGTYYGEFRDESNSVAVDNNNNVYITGTTLGTTGISTVGAHQTVHAGSFDAFLVKFNAAGVRQWATYYGGTARDYGLSVATDGNDNVYLAGYTESLNGISSATAHQTIHGGGNRDAFLVKFNAAGVRQWGTYYGGNQDDRGFQVATDGNDNAYLTGFTQSTNGISTTGSHQQNYDNSVDIFLVKFDASGVRQWGTYYGGTKGESLPVVATDNGNNVYLAGYTESINRIATPGSFQDVYTGITGTIFLAKFNTSGVRQWGTYLAGSKQETYPSIIVDKTSDFLLIAGETTSSDFPTTSCVSKPNAGRKTKTVVFVAQFKPNGDLFSSSYYGHNSENVGGIAEYDCHIYLTGTVFEISLASPPAIKGAHQTIYGGGNGDAFLAQLYKSTNGLTLPTATHSTYSSQNTNCSNCNGFAKIALLQNCFSSYTYTWSNGTQFVNTSDTTSIITGLCEGEYWVKITDKCNDLIDSAYFRITTTCCANPPVLSVVTQTNEICGNANASAEVIVTSGTGTPSYTYEWSNGQNIAGASGLKAGTYQAIVYDLIGCSDSVSVTITDDNSFCGCIGIQTNKKFSSITSVIPNPSFEEKICCPAGTGMVYCVSSWMQASIIATSDYMNSCGLTTAVGNGADFPLPGGGDGFAGFLNNQNNYKEYVGTCLRAPMLAGVPYKVNLSLAYSGGNQNLEFAIFGTPNCGDLPWTSTGCPIGEGGWTTLFKKTINFPNNQSWQTVEVIFTPTVDIYAVALGPSCSPVSGTANYYNIDQIIMERLDSFIVDSRVTESGDFCTDDLMLTASIDTFGGTWQWYDGATALAGETNPTLDIMPLGDGDYTAIYTLGGECDATSYKVVTPPCDCELTVVTQQGTSNCLSCSCKEWVMVNTTSGTAPFSYSWSGLSSTQDTGRYQNKLCPGNYDVTVTDGAGCVELISVIVP